MPLYIQDGIFIQIIQFSLIIYYLSVRPHFAKDTSQKLPPEKQPLEKTRNKFPTSHAFLSFPRKKDESFFGKNLVIAGKNSGHFQNRPVPFPNFSIFPSNNRIFRKNIPDIFWDSISVLFCTKLVFTLNKSRSQLFTFYQ